MVRTVRAISVFQISRLLRILNPRRLAAVGVCTRVAEEMECAVGSKVGFMVRGESKASAQTQILFCTYGVILRRLQVWFHGSVFAFVKCFVSRTGGP
jgi:HrpA-like RNA helicase